MKTQSLVVRVPVMVWTVAMVVVAAALAHTGICTVIVVVAVKVPVVARIVAAPPATPVTSPLLFTVAMAGCRLSKVNGTLEIASLLRLRAIAASCWVPPTPRVAVTGVRVTRVMVRSGARDSAQAVPRTSASRSAGSDRRSDRRSEADRGPSKVFYNNARWTVGSPVARRSGLTALHHSGTEGTENCNGMVKGV